MVDQFRGIADDPTTLTGDPTAHPGESGDTPLKPHP